MWFAAMVLAAMAQGAVGLLLWAGMGHLRHAGPLRAALEAQALLPRAIHGPVAVSLPVAELAVGGYALVMLVAAPRRSAPALVTVAVVYLALASYTALVLRIRPKAPCGCFGDGAPITAAVVTRAAGAAAAAGLCAATVDSVAWSLSARVLCLGAGLALTAVARSFATAQPSAARAAQ